MVAELLAVRKNLGLQMPGPQQRAMVAALDDDEHVAEQHERYAARRAVLRRALEAAGFEITHSEASLYLWATRGEDCWDTVAWLAERGILVAPGAFYGTAGRAARAGGVHRHGRAGRGGAAPVVGLRATATRRGQRPMPAFRWSITGPCASCGLNRITFASFSTRTLWPAGQWKTSPPEQRSSEPSV